MSDGSVFSVGENRTTLPQHNLWMAENDRPRKAVRRVLKPKRVSSAAHYVPECPPDIHFSVRGAHGEFDGRRRGSRRDLAIPLHDRARKASARPPTVGPPPRARASPPANRFVGTPSRGPLQAVGQH